MRSIVLHRHLPMPIAEMRPYSLLCLKLEFGESAEKLRVLLSDPQQQTVSNILVGDMVLGAETSIVKKIWMKLYLYSSSSAMDTQYLHYWYRSAKHCKKKLKHFHNEFVGHQGRLLWQGCKVFSGMSWCFLKTVFTSLWLNRNQNLCSTKWVRFLTAGRKRHKGSAWNTCL